MSAELAHRGADPDWSPPAVSLNGGMGTSGEAVVMAEQGDDAAAGGRDGQGDRTIRVPWRVPAVPGARRVLAEDLKARGLNPQLVSEAEIVVSELVTNSVRHARALPDGTVRVHWKVKGQAMEVEVTDGGGTTHPVPAPRSAWSATGRGLRIVRSLAHEWGVVEDKGTRTVWVALGGPSRRRTV